jgi:uncharacterized membrane protein YphA (DoxX/SURF4 family)
MTITRRIARPLLAAQFVYGGLDQLRKPSAKTDGGGPIIPALAGLSLGPVTLPSDKESLVRLNGGVMAGAGALLGIGRFPRLASLVLATSLVPTTLTGHRFWEEEDPEKRQAAIAQVLKNTAIFGGLLISSVDTNGKPGLTWRAQHATKTARRTAKAATAGVAASTTAATKSARKVAAKNAKKNAKARKSKSSKGSSLLSS